MLTLHTLDSAVTFLAVASRAFSRKPDAEGRRGVVLTGGEFGTVSSTLLSLPRKIQHSIYQYCDGPPSERPYEDLSALLRQVLSAGRSRKPPPPTRKTATGQGQGPQDVEAAQRVSNSAMTAKRRIGIWLIGAKGGVAATTIVGLAALRQGTRRRRRPGQPAAAVRRAGTARLGRVGRRRARNPPACRCCTRPCAWPPRCGPPRRE